MNYAKLRKLRQSLVQRNSFFRHINVTLYAAKQAQTNNISKNELMISMILTSLCSHQKGFLRSRRVMVVKETKV